jgi:hypothetical protein
MGIGDTVERRKEKSLLHASLRCSWKFSVTLRRRDRAPYTRRRDVWILRDAPGHETRD